MIVLFIYCCRLVVFKLFFCSVGMLKFYVEYKYIKYIKMECMVRVSVKG